MNEITQTLLDIDQICQDHDLPYAVIGGIAGIVHGHLRTTQDIDLTIAGDLAQLERIVQSFAAKFFPAVENPLAFFQELFVLPLQHHQTGVRVDITAGLSGFEQQMIQRSRRLVFDTATINVCTVEDLILFKLFADRDKDRLDVAALYQLHHNHLDIAYLTAQTAQFVELDRPDIAQKLAALLKTNRQA